MQVWQESESIYIDSQVGSTEPSDTIERNREVMCSAAARRLPTYWKPENFLVVGANLAISGLDHFSFCRFSKVWRDIISFKGIIK
jgi:hypothetical protein